MNQTTEQQFKYSLVKRLYNEAIENTDCPKCLQEDCYELERLLDKIETHNQKTHRCFV